MALTDSTRETIETLLTSNRVVLFMKGTPQAPMCGFSANASRILNALVPDYATFNVLEDEEIREGIKLYGNWPTIPQLYIDRELVGGSDIISQMFNSGELYDLLGVERPDRTPPEITITDTAAEAIRAGMEDHEGVGLMLKIDDYWRPEFSLAPLTGSEIKASANGLDVHMDVLTAQRARGMKIDYVDSIQGSGLTVDLPAAPPAVREVSVQQLKQWLDEDAVVLVDTRRENERAQASIESALVLDKAGMAQLNEMPKDTRIAFICHVGRSSLGVAEHFRKEGFTELYNVTGGIDAWAREIDSSVPTY